MPGEPFGFAGGVGKAEVVKLASCRSKFGLTVADSVDAASMFACVASAAAFTSV